MIGSHVTLEINESLRECASAIGANQASVRAMGLQQVLDHQMVIGKFFRAAVTTLEKVFSVSGVELAPILYNLFSSDHCSQN